MTHTHSILLIAQPGHLRDSLQVILTALSGGRPVVLESGWPEEPLGSVNGLPVLVLAVLEPGSSENEVNAAITHIKIRWPQTRLVVLVDTEQQRQVVASAGADRVWFKGTLAAQMLAEIEVLLNQ